MSIKTRRVAREMSQKDLAKVVGVDQSTVHLWESGKTMPRIPVLKELAKFFECSVDDLICDGSEVDDSCAK